MGIFCIRLLPLENVWVLNPKALATFIQNQKKSLEPDMVKMIVKHMKAYVRMTQVNK